MRSKIGRHVRHNQVNSQLGKTFFGKIFAGIADAAIGFANVAVTPIEGILNTQIIGNQYYSDTGFGNFVEKSQEVNSTLNAVIGNIVSDVFTGGAVPIYDVDKTTAQAQAQVQTAIDAQRTEQLKQQAILDALQMQITNKQLTAELQGRTKTVREDTIGVIMGFYNKGVQVVENTLTKI